MVVVVVDNGVLVVVVVDDVLIVVVGRVIYELGMKVLSAGISETALLFGGNWGLTLSILRIR